MNDNTTSPPIGAGDGESQGSTGSSTSLGAQGSQGSGYGVGGSGPSSVGYGASSEGGVGSSGISGGSLSGSGLSEPGISSGSYEQQGFQEKAGSKLEEGKVQAKRLGEKARRRAVEVADSKKGTWASQLDNLADALDEVSQTFEEKGVPAQKWVGSAADTVRRFSSDIQGKSTEEILQRAEATFRERPGAFIAGFFAIGFFGARLLRS